MKLALLDRLKRKTNKSKSGKIVMGKRIVVTPTLYSVSGASFLGPFVFRKTQ